MTADLAVWLRQQLDDDERIAREAAKHAGAALATAASGDGVWKPPYDGAEWWNDYDHVFVVCDRRGQPPKAMIADCGHGAFMLTPHIARHDPARVLRRIAAMREHIDGLLAEKHRSCEDTWYNCSAADQEGNRDSTQECDCGRDERVTRSLRLLAAEYTDRPGYAEAIKA